MVGVGLFRGEILLVYGFRIVFRRGFMFSSFFRRSRCGFTFVLGVVKKVLLEGCWDSEFGIVFVFRRRAILGFFGSVLLIFGVV